MASEHTVSWSRMDAGHLTSAAVVVGVDGSRGADAAVGWAAESATRRGRELRIVHGLALGGMRAAFARHDIRESPVLDAVRTHGTMLVEQAAQRARQIEPAVRVSTEVSELTPAQLLIRHSVAANRVVLGASEPNAHATHTGSVLLAVSAHAQGAVVVVRTDPTAGHRVRAEGPIVVGVDGSPVSEPAIDAAFEEATERRVPLVVVHVWSDLRLTRYAGLSDFLPRLGNVQDGESALLSERLAGWQEKYPDVTVERHVHLADPVRKLREWSTTAQLLVVGSRGRGGFVGALLGSTSNSLVHQAYCPVMVVHPAR